MDATVAPDVRRPGGAYEAGTVAADGETAACAGMAAAVAAFIETRLDSGLLCEDAVDVEILAAHVGYSRFHFSRMFAAAVGMGPGKYLAAARLRRAKQLLLANADPVADVCTAVGFTSLSTFTRQFREAVGTTPAAFRRIAQSVADSPVAPFALLPAQSGEVEVVLRVPTSPMTALRRPPQIWIGWFPTPAPVGLPFAGRLLTATDCLRLPLCPGAPWLLAFAVDSQADPADVLAPQVPLVARHPSPLTSPASVSLDFAPALPPNVPLLPALPALVPGIAD